MFESVADLMQRYVIGPIAKDPYWEATAFVGEAIFGGRFILQWIVSEIKKRSCVPTAFWYMSIVGSLILLVYSVHIEKPVLILAFTLQIGIYIRNLALIKKHKGGEDNQKVESEDLEAQNDR